MKTGCAPDNVRTKRLTFSRQNVLMGQWLYRGSGLNVDMILGMMKVEG